MMSHSKLLSTGGLSIVVGLTASLLPFADVIEGKSDALGIAAVVAGSLLIAAGAVVTLLGLLARHKDLSRPRTYSELPDGEKFQHNAGTYQGARHGVQGYSSGDPCP